MRFCEHSLDKIRYTLLYWQFHHGNRDNAMSNSSQRFWISPSPATKGGENLPTGADIASYARKRVGQIGYKTYGYGNETPSGIPKDHHFVADTLEDAGIGFGDRLKDRPSIDAWASPSSAILGWQPVSDGSVQAGDVLATTKRIPQSWYNGGGQQLGIATGEGTSVGIVDNDRVGENTFGHEPDHNPTVWRSTQLSDGPTAGEANSQQLSQLFEQYADDPKNNGRCRATGTCDITR